MNSSFSFRKSNEDTITVYLRAWILRKIFNKNGVGFAYKSSIYNFEFNSFREYWMRVGATRLPEKQLTIGKVSMRGFSNREAAVLLARAHTPNDRVAVLYNIDPQEMVRFIERIPGFSYNHYDDFLILTGKSRESVQRLVEQIPDSVGDAIGVDHGEWFCSNSRSVE